MSLMKTLAKVAIGVAVAKGASSLMKQRGSTGKSGSEGGLGGLLGGLTGGGTPSGAGRGTPYRGGQSGGLEGVLGGLLGGTGGASGGLGGLLNQLGGSGAGRSGGGLGGLLGGLAGAGGLLGGASQMAKRQPEREEADFGAVLNSQFSESPQDEITPSRDQEALAALMLAAMIQAAKSDGTFDADEREKLLKHLGDVDAQEAAFVNQQLAAPVGIDALVAETPEGLGPQVYTMSLLGIDLDTQAEAQYLHKLAQAYGMTPDAVNNIHARLGVPSLYT